MTSLPTHQHSMFPNKPTEAHWLDTVTNKADLQALPSIHRPRLSFQIFMSLPLDLRVLHTLSNTLQPLRGHIPRAILPLRAPSIDTLAHILSLDVSLPAPYVVVYPRKIASHYQSQSRPNGTSCITLYQNELVLSILSLCASHFATSCTAFRKFLTMESE